ncbi:DUF2185 domain-containing protein [Blastopirellula sp. JC732]|uniref:DUF2185 domain-containing protein n=1 Tax=Blastopirellula sediminis TaxID=2894196 RepID=A0A9X1MM97_9BACT|nr:DUF2185 domain-containing protein [Blastopirellula sediminis]MCC9608731.1 DUF2185 domain-containing protein [Blastopirellula sediminis]MCC9628492.1 DUF2185 domain-containing protein [Blastopirellula sediminis]
MNWPFPDEPNVVCFTSKSVVEEGAWIHYVSHDEEDGAWQFHSLDGIPESESDARIVSLRTMLRIDPRLAEIADLPLGWIAWRDSVDEPWKRCRSPED